MKSIKVIAGILCVPLAALPPHVMYAMSEDGNLWDIVLFSMMLLAAVVSFVCFAVSRYLFSTKGKRVIAGIFASYTAMLVLLVVSAVITSDLSETMMWMPVILIFGIPFMAPLIGISFLGSTLIFGNKEKSTEK